MLAVKNSRKRRATLSPARAIDSGTIKEPESLVGEGREAGENGIICVFMVAAPGPRPRVERVSKEPNPDIHLIWRETS
jgi:hypothetical protein